MTDFTPVYVSLHAEHPLSGSVKRKLLSTTKIEVLCDEIYAKLGAKPGSIVVVDELEKDMVVPLPEYFEGVTNYARGKSTPEIGTFNTSDNGTLSATAHVTGELRVEEEQSPHVLIACPKMLERSKSNKKRTQIWMAVVTNVLPVWWPRRRENLSKLVLVG